MKEVYRVRTPTVIHEVFDDEVVIVNLDSGDYYSLSDAGAVCWNCLLAGCSIDETVDAISRRYEGESDEIKAAVQNLVGEFEAADLVVRGVGDAPSPELNHAGIGSKPAFVAPVLHGYSDMRDLLLIDPIHDVDQTGWPTVKDESADSAEE